MQSTERSLTGRLLGLLVVLCLLAAAPVTAQETKASATVADRLAEALDAYSELDNERGLAITNELLGRNDLTANDSVAIYEVKSIITYSMGEQFFQESLQYLQKISTIGPCVVPMPREFWPQELRDRWYQILHKMGQLTCDQKSDVKTIAIMKFDNFSTGEYQETLGLLSKGLADFFAHDFGQISDFQVVERDKIDFILKELELVKEGAVDPATAVKVGKLLGARYMVFGSITQIDSRNTRMVVRVVDVETSEIIASKDKEGRPDYVTMEKELVKEIASELEVSLNEETMGLIDQSGTESVDAATLYSKGLEFMDRYEYKAAYEHFKKAYEMDSSFAEAKRKMEIYRPLAG